MRIIAFFAAGALAAGTLVAAAPADAQRYGWDGPRGGGHHDRGWHGPRIAMTAIGMAVTGAATGAGTGMDIAAAIAGTTAAIARITAMAGRVAMAARASCAGSSAAITARFAAVSVVDTEP